MPNLGYSILPTEDRSPFSSPGQISVPTFSSSTTPKQFRRARLWSIFRRLALFAVLGVLFFEFGARSGGSSSLETANKLWSSAVGDRRSPTHNSGWVLFDDRFDSPYLRRYTTTAPVSQNELLLTEACRDLWISRLQICPQLQKGWLPGKSLLRRSQRWDIVHTWQNGSATLQQQARTQAINDSADRGDSGNAIRHFREHDELRYSLRSVFKAYGKHVSAIDNFYVISTDLPSNNKGERIGMVPSWMDIEHPFHQQASVTPVFPWQIHKSSAFDAPQEAERWRAETLPVFNSMAVESQFANVPTGNDIWLMSCDDFFLLNSHTPSDVSVHLEPS